MKKTWDNLNQEAIHKSIDLQPEIMRAIVAAGGGQNSYITNGVAKS